MIVFSATPSSVTEPPVRLTQDAAKALRVLSGVGLKTGPGRTAENGGLLTATGEDDVISGVEIGPWEHRYCSSYRLSTADLVRLHQTLDHIAAAPGIRVV